MTKADRNFLEVDEELERVLAASEKVSPPAKKAKKDGSGDHEDQEVADIAAAVSQKVGTVSLLNLQCTYLGRYKTFLNLVSNIVT